jgi:TolB-like protein/Flp pilus assembly protein TadD
MVSPPEAGQGLPDHPIAESSIPSPEAVRQQLQALLASRPFVTATRARRFLTYVVEQTLAGETDAIKELVLGIEVFDRPADFDPKVDTIVRVEAGKLRKRLEEYYADEGCAAAVRIEVPKGSYVPQFLLAAPTPGPVVPAVAVTSQRWYAAGIVALLLIAAGVWGAWRFRVPPAPVNPSIAVLPFLNLSADPGSGYFTDGLAEELTDALSNLGGLRVAARTSAFMFRNKPVDVQEIGAKLHVGYVVEGSVRKQGDQLMVTAQLIRTDDGYHVWSGSFERQLSDVFKVQQELAGSVVSALQMKLTGAQTRRLRKSHTANRQAFDLFLQGIHLMSSFAPGSLDQAESRLQESIAADPNYALSYAALAAVHIQSDIYGNRPSSELAAKASAAVHKALALDDELAEAYVVRSTLAARHEYDWPAAERYLRHALALNPNLAPAHYGLAHFVYAPQGRWQEALAESRLASELDPLSPMITMSEPWLAVLEGRHEAAVGGFRRLAVANPLDIMAGGGLGIALAGKGDYPAALEAIQKVERIAPSNQNLAFVGYLYARMGNPAETRKILRHFESERRFVSPVVMRMLYAGLGDADEVFRYAEIAREQQDSSLIFTRVAPVWDGFRDDPRYFKLLSEIGLSDEQIHKNQQRK